MDSAQHEERRLRAARGLRALADGCVAVLLPTYLLALGHDAFAVGVLATAALLAAPLALWGALTIGYDLALWRAFRRQPQAESIEVEASHLGLGLNPLVLWAVADRLAQPEGGWQPFARDGWRRWLYGEPPAQPGHPG